MQIPSEFSVILIICATLLLISGIVLLVLGWRGKRTGSEPRCARCGYILLHIESARCPECGAEIAVVGTVTGKRKRRWWLASLGAAMLVLAVMLVYRPAADFIAGIYWYQYKPETWVFRDMDEPGPPGVRAMYELTGRDSNGKLSPAGQQRLIESALHELESSGKSRLLRYLGAACAAGRLDPQQQQRFVDHVYQMTLSIRPIVGEGEGVPLQVDRKALLRSIDGGLFSCMFGQQERRVDGTTVAPPDDSDYSQGDTQRSIAPSGGLGEHVLEQDMICDVSYYTHGSREPRAIGTSKATLKASYLVVRPEELPAIELLESESLRTELSSALKVNEVKAYQFYAEENPRERVWFARVGLRVKTLPCDIGFDVFLKTSDGQLAIGQVWAEKGDDSILYTEVRTAERLPEKVDVILRPSIAAARRTVAAQSIYGREIRFPGVAVVRDEPSAETPPVKTPTTEPTGPRNLQQLWGKGNKVALGWEGPSKNQGYQVWRSTREDFSDAQRIAVTPPNVTTYVDKVPDPTQQYYYQIFPHDPDAASTQPAGE